MTGQRRILVTGAASGIGLATAQQLAARGDRLFLLDAAGDALAQVAASLHAAYAVVDITEPEAVQAAVTAALAALGGLDGVIHCAGVLYSGLYMALPLQQQRRMMDVNLFGTLVVLRAVTPALQATRGALLLTGSVASFYGAPEEAMYGATKAGVLSLAEAARLELDGSGVHVGVICPHFAATPMVAQNPDVRLYRLMGVQHTAEAVAQAIVRGLDQRSWMIAPPPSARLVWWLYHYAHWLIFPLLRRSWRRAQRLKT